MLSATSTVRAPVAAQQQPVGHERAPPALRPWLKLGRFDRPASLLDIAPTLADLIGLRVANPWQGHSLLAVGDATAIAAVVGVLLLGPVPDGYRGSLTNYAALKAAGENCFVAN